MPSHRRSPGRPAPRHLVVHLAALCAVLLAAGCGGSDGDPEPSDDPTATSSASSSASSPVTDTPGDPVGQPPLPADPSGYTPDYVQATLEALFTDYGAAVTAYQASGEIDDTVRAALANVYHPDVYDQQIRNLEDYFPGGENLEDPPGRVVVEVTDIHSVTADCILAVTTYDISAVTTLEAPSEDGFFIGLARNEADADGTRPWLITVEYTTSDGAPLPEDVCA